MQEKRATTGTGIKGEGKEKKSGGRRGHLREEKKPLATHPSTTKASTVFHPHPTLTRPPLPSREREKRMARRGKGGGKRGKKTGTRGRRERGKKSNDRDRY